MSKVIRWSIVLLAVIFALFLKTIVSNAVVPSALSGAIIGVIFFGFIFIVWKLTESLEKPNITTNLMGKIYTGVVLLFLLCALIAWNYYGLGYGTGKSLFTGTGVDKFIGSSSKPKKPTANINKKIPPQNYLAKGGGVFNFPKLERSQFSQIFHVCEFYSLQQLKHDFPLAPLTKYQVGGELRMYFNLINEECEEQQFRIK